MTDTAPSGRRWLVGGGLVCLVAAASGAVSLARGGASGGPFTMVAVGLFLFGAWSGLATAGVLRPGPP